MGGVGYQSSSSSNSSKPLSPQERRQLYDKSLASIMGTYNKTLADGSLPTYDSPVYQGLNDGDYNKLQSDMLQGYTTGIDQAKATDARQLDESLSQRGIWSSGLAAQDQNDLNQKYAGEYGKAGANATNARYQTQLQDQQAGNQFNLTNAQNQFSAGWQPLSYLQQLWSGTGGQVSKGSMSSTGMNVSAG